MFSDLTDPDYGQHETDPDYGQHETEEDEQDTDDNSGDDYQDLFDLRDMII